MLLISYQWFWFLSSIPHSAYEEKKITLKDLLTELSFKWIHHDLQLLTVHVIFLFGAMLFNILFVLNTHLLFIELRWKNRCWALFWLCYLFFSFVLSNTPWSSFLFSKCLSHKNLWSFLSGIYFKLSSTEQQQSCVYGSFILIKYCSCFCLSPVLNLC